MQQKPYDKHFDIILSSSELRRIVRERLDENNVSLFKLCAKLDIDSEEVTIWLTKSYNQLISTRKSKLHHDMIGALCSELGINIRLQVVVGMEWSPSKDIIADKGFDKWVFKEKK